MAIQKFTEDVEKYLEFASDTGGTTQQDYQVFVRNMYNLTGNLIDGLRLWQPTTLYKQGEIVVSPSMNPNTWARVTKAGVTGSLEPSSWGASGGTVGDGTVTYTIVPRTLDFAADSEITAGAVSDKVISPKALKAVMNTELAKKLNVADFEAEKSAMEQGINAKTEAQITAAKSEMAKQIPTKVSQLTNDASYVTSTQLDTALSGLDGTVTVQTVTDTLSRTWTCAKCGKMVIASVGTFASNSYSSRAVTFPWKAAHAAYAAGGGEDGWDKNMHWISLPANSAVATLRGQYWSGSESSGYNYTVAQIIYFTND